MLDELRNTKSFREVIEGLVGDPALVDRLLDVPVLALYHQWSAFAFLPFFAATNAAESISLDLASRALRYEALRTGRMEIVLGRFCGQLVLLAGAASTGAVLVWILGLTRMVGNEPFALAFALAGAAVQGWFYALPYVGVGVGASQWTTSPATARVLATAAIALSWVAYAFVGYFESEGHPWVGAALASLLPQGWLRGLWEVGLPAWTSYAACAAFACVGLCGGYLRFARRDL